MTEVRGPRVGVNEVGVTGLKPGTGAPVERRPNKDGQPPKDTRVRDIDTPAKGQPTNAMFVTASPNLKVSEVLPTPLSPLLPLAVGDSVSVELSPDQSLTHSRERFSVRRLPDVGYQHAYEVSSGTPPGTLVFSVVGLLNGITPEGLVDHACRFITRESPAVTPFKMLGGEPMLLMTCPDLATSIAVVGSSVQVRDVSALAHEGCVANTFYFDMLGFGLWKGRNNRILQCLTPRLNRKPLAQHVWSEPTIVKSIQDFGVNGEQVFFRGLTYWLDTVS